MTVKYEFKIEKKKILRKQISIEISKLIVNRNAKNSSFEDSLEKYSRTPHPTPPPSYDAIFFMFRKRKRIEPIIPSKTHKLPKQHFKLQQTIHFLKC